MKEKQPFLKQKIDLESPNKNIVPITTTIGGDGKLSVGGCSIEELVKKYDSPLYILDEITLRNSCKAYKKALEKYYPGKSLPIYASKANSSIFMSSLVSSEGLGLDAVSEGELLTAIKGGVPNEKIVFHGNNKSDKELEFAVRNNIKVIVDNDYDLERLDDISNSFNNDLEIKNEFGDIYFTLLNLSNFLKINPESALQKTNKKFLDRFSIIEHHAGDNIKKQTPKDFQRLWQIAKRKLKRKNS